MSAITFRPALAGGALAVLLTMVGIWLLAAAEPITDVDVRWRQSKDRMIAGELEWWDALLRVTGARKEALILTIDRRGQCRLTVEKGTVFGHAPQSRMAVLPDEARLRMLDAWAGTIERYSFENLKAKTKDDALEVTLSLKTRYQSVKIEELALEKAPQFQADLKKLVQATLEEIETATNQ